MLGGLNMGGVRALDGVRGADWCLCAAKACARCEYGRKMGGRLCARRESLREGARCARVCASLQKGGCASARPKESAHTRLKERGRTSRAHVGDDYARVVLE